MKSDTGVKLLIAAAALLASALSTSAVSLLPSNGLAAPENFATIEDTEARSAALFGELAKVLTHPRCVNCHPAGDRPRQGDMMRLHQPPVERGADGHGLAAMRCSSCHRETNFDPARVPGDPNWHLAPREMAWENRTASEICAQIKDPARNGGRSLEEIATHIGSDHLVGWAWQPGAGRQSAPGTQAAAGALVDAWVKSGAACPK
ncbi:Isoquinoline 1-oxidoreductase subunit [Bradyrhizobium sp. NP1]|uniref:Isoquinoline 1-oxidoreductase subunit n=1 Tax=Bradyrhizobium sp. NP1 TaxID=3049772 RepID=UPI0025A55108|nr:Isoquinoline 1-oxidoreductase subunit [Bradyrhizobium sp. NP1]WJR77427.1 Isoquinoline 1-oxidoreductase subunit [Bradyrhizobium sp. NP1]